MRAVLQRVSSAAVKVDGEVIGEIGKGILVLIGVSGEDTLKDAEYIADKILHLRIFSDEEGKMNRSVQQSGGSVLAVSQFTLYGDARKGRRPSFNSAAGGELGLKLFNYTVETLRASGLKIATGKFGAMMDVESINNGPVTILIDSQKTF